MKIKYIYFEVNHITGSDPTQKSVENENVLLIKPHTNSSGIWGFENMTEIGFSQPSFSIVNQYWIDLEKFNNSKYLLPVEVEFENYVDIALKKIKVKLRKEKLQKITYKEG